MTAGRASRAKGARFERWVANAFREAMPGEDIRRGYQRVAASGEADVECPAFWVECKVGKKQNPRAALAQAQKETVAGKTPIAVVKDDGQKPFVVIGFGDFIEFVNEWWESRQ